MKQLSVRAWIIPVAGMAVAGLLWLVLPGLIRGQSQAASEHPTASQPDGFKATEGQWATLSFAKVETRLFADQRETDGRIAIDDDVSTPVLSPLSGRVVKVLGKAGDLVRKGDPLLIVDGSEYVQGESDLAVALAGLGLARTQLAQAEIEEKRQHQLYDDKGAALKDWQQSQTELAASQAAAKTAAATLAAARNRLRILGRTDGDIAVLEAVPDRANRPAESAVPAPIAGTITSRAVNPGQYISSAANGGQPIYTISDLKHLWLVANLREADASFAQVGDKVAVRVPAYPGRAFEGVVTYVSPVLDPATRRLPLHAGIVNEDGALKPDMFASFRIVSQANAISAPAVPEAGVIFEGDKARVWIADPAAKSLSLRAIKAGRSQDGLIAAEGVQPGEMVVTKGALFIDRAARTD